jgi:aminopeptidase N
MTLQQISQRGKEYLKTAETVLRAAQNMTDRAIAGQLKALADDYQRRAEKTSHVDAAKGFARSAANAEGSITAQTAEEIRGER